MAHVVVNTTPIRSRSRRPLHTIYVCPKEHIGIEIEHRFSVAVGVGRAVPPKSVTVRCVKRIKYTPRTDVNWCHMYRYWHVNDNLLQLIRAIAMSITQENNFSYSLYDKIKEETI